MGLYEELNGKSRRKLKHGLKMPEVHGAVNGKVKEKQCSVLFRFLRATLTLKFFIYDSFCKWERINSLPRIFFIYYGKPLRKSSYFVCFERPLLQNYKSPLQWENTCSESTIEHLTTAIQNGIHTLLPHKPAFKNSFEVP